MPTRERRALLASFEDKHANTGPASRVGMPTLRGVAWLGSSRSPREEPLAQRAQQ
jgi:hypothetical protein